MKRLHDWLEIYINNIIQQSLSQTTVYIHIIQDNGQTFTCKDVKQNNGFFSKAQNTARLFQMIQELFLSKKSLSMRIKYLIRKGFQ